MRGIVVAGLALLALGAAPAQADVTIGSTLTAAPDAVLPAPSAGGSTVAPASGVAPEAGVITRWRVRAGAQVTPVRLRILRPVATDHVEIARSGTVTPPAGRTSVYPVRIPILAGDRIALECCAASLPGEFFVTGSATSVEWQPAITDGQTVADGASTQLAVQTSINADLEPDADADQFGDETQDDCPVVAGPANGCPAADPPPPPPPPPPPAAPRVNTPPAVRFKTPLMGRAVSPVQIIELDVADDAGSPTVGVFDDDGTICTLSAAPYTCTWRPTGADVGRATLLASAVDSDGTSTLGIVRVTVPRFEATLTRKRKGRRVSGTLKLPAAVERSLGCRGTVTVRRGKVKRTAALSRRCTYSVRLPKGRGSIRARFGGNPVVAPT